MGRINVWEGKPTNAAQIAFAFRAMYKRNLDSRIVEISFASRIQILGFGIWNTSQGIRNLTNSQNPVSIFHGVEFRFQDFLEFLFMGRCFCNRKTI